MGETDSFGSENVREALIAWGRLTPDERAEWNKAIMQAGERDAAAAAEPGDLAALVAQWQAAPDDEGGAARACMRDLARLSTDTGAGVLLVAHDTKAARNEAKAGGNPGAGAVAGSGQWFDAARGVLYLHGGGARMLECVKCNHGRAGWGVELGEVGGEGGRPFRGFVRGAWVAGVEAVRAAKADAARTAKPGGAGKGAAGGTVAPGTVGP